MSKINISINSNITTYEWNERSLFGELFLEIDDLIFPEKDWSDIISSVLNMWVDNIINILQSNLKEGGEFYFMDGPYHFKVADFEDEMIHITLLKSNIAVNEKSYRISFFSLLSEISKVINNLNTNESLRRVKDIKILEKKYVYMKKLLELRDIKF